MTDPQRPTIFTIVSCNYAAQARVLMQSLKQHEPEVDRVVVVSDGVLNSSEVDGAMVIGVSELVDEGFVRSMTTYYDALEFNTAIKPFCCTSLLQRAARLVYLDPDIRLFDSLSPVWRGFDDADLLLTPHLLKPMQEGGHPNSADILKSGIYNLGFIALQRAPEVVDFLAWWSKQCTFDCRVDFSAGLFTDQRWADFAPCFVHRTSIIRDPGLNVAYWNLPERLLEKVGDRWTSDGAALRFFHFSGFNPARPDLLSKHQDRIRVEANSPLSGLLKSYSMEMIAAGSASALKRPYAFSTFADGRRVTPRMRRAFLQAARAGRDLAGGLDALQSAWIDGIDPASLAAGAPLTWAGEPWRQPMVGSAQPAAADDQPWLGRARDAAIWLREDRVRTMPRIIEVFVRARRDLMQVQPIKQTEGGRLLTALCIGLEAAEGRFAVDLICQQDLVALADDTVLLEAARLWRPNELMSDPIAAIVARFSLAAAADWPSLLRGGLLSVVDSPADTLWRERPDLQAAFDLLRPVGRAKLYRWFKSVAIEEYRLDARTLPFAYHLGLRTRRHGGGSRTSARRSDVKLLHCAPTRLASFLAGTRWYDTTRGTFSDGGLPPKHVELCLHYGELAEAALGWTAMYRRGVTVGLHLWAPSPDASEPTAVDPAWSFVDAVWPTEAWRTSYPRPAAEHLDIVGIK